MTWRSHFWRHLDLDPGYDSVSHQSTAEGISLAKALTIVRQMLKLWHNAPDFKAAGCDALCSCVNSMGEGVP